MSNKFNSTRINKFHDEIKGDQNHRYKSWEYCFNAFKTLKDNDTLALHLGFYLASWGMYRGSSGMLQKDYKIHVGAIEILIKPKYEELHCVNHEVTVKDIDLILELKQELSKYYKTIEYSKKVGENKKIQPTNTLITKIILGTLGCLPAYDKYFIDGLKTSGMSGFSIYKKSLQNLFEFINKNKESLLQTQKEISKNGIHYPIMKLVDMHFWIIGFEGKKNKKRV